ncbi:MAG: alpha/beta fold hydrolase [Flavobacteriales bacterium]|nr:alpha/beta fold hydrolase [Flavobacteriales bacterium]
MKLHYRVMGEGEPLFILHGLFGSGDNWQTLAKQYADHFEVYLIDARNHGKSPHSEVFNYEVMAEDLLELIFDLQLMQVNILGHSMGGKTAMFFAKMRPELVHRMVIADMGVKGYSSHHDLIIKGLLSIDFEQMTSRTEVDEALSEYVPDLGTRSFLTKSLYWIEKGKLAWRMNVEVIAENLEKVMIGLPEGDVDIETLFLAGANSDYLPETDFAQVRKHFPEAEFITLPDAGHWLHADQPALFLDESKRFLLS